MKNILRAGCAFGALMLPATAGLAQSTQSTQTAEVAPGKQLEQIIVTASRRKENLQRAAIAVTAVSSAQLESAGVVSARDLSKTVAGLSITANGAGAQTYLRGVGTFATSTYASSPIATNLDGIYLGLPAFTNGIFYDIARVEVLKGPQGTLYGKNATAGAINIITSQPTNVTSGYASFEAGNYGLFKTAGAANLPVSDKFSVRVAAQFLDRNGYYSDHTGRTMDESVRITALYKPTSDISLTVGADYQHASGEEEPLVVFGANPKNPWEGPTTAVSNANIYAARNPADPYGIGLPPFFSALLPPITGNDFALRNDNAGIREDLEWNLGGANLSVISAYRHLSTLWITDPGFEDRQSGIGHQESVEIRLSSPSNSSKLKWQIGAYYYDNSETQELAISQGFVKNNILLTNGDKSGAVFGELTYSLLPRLRLTGGLRGTAESATQSGEGGDFYTPAAQASLAGFLAGVEHVPSFLIPGIVAETLAPIPYGVGNATSTRNISVKAGIEYDAAPNSLLYANFATGFKSSGLNSDENTPTDSNIYKPERLDAYSIGSKNRFLDGTLQLNGEAFYWDYHDHQEIYLTQSAADPSVSIPETHNIGSATVKGFSADIQYRFAPETIFATQLEYLNATFNQFKYTEFSTPGITPGTGCAVSIIKQTVVLGQAETLNGINCSGEPFTRAPHWSINASLQHTYVIPGNKGDIVGLVTTHFNTSQWLATDYIALEHESAYTITDINLTYEPPSGRWSVTAYAHNLENTAAYSSAFEYAFAKNVVVGGINPPRTFGGIFKLRF